MPQVFQVLKCYKCSAFQVHQSKKSIKWQCKLCGEKQSIKRHYGIGTGKECRLHVQKLNGIRGEIEELNDLTELSKSSDEECELNEESCSYRSKTCDQGRIKSKWSSYVDKTDQMQAQEITDKMFLGDTEVVLEVPTKKRKKFIAQIVIPETANSTWPKTNVLEKTTQPENQKTLIMFDDDFSSENTFQKLDKLESNGTFSKHEALTTDDHFKKFKKIHELDSFNEIENNMQNKAVQKKYIPPKVDKNSKWAQFTDEPDENENFVSLSTENLLQNEKLQFHNSEKTHISSLFTLCDEYDLDDVLDF